MTMGGGTIGGNLEPIPIYVGLVGLGVAIVAFEIAAQLGVDDRLDSLVNQVNASRDTDALRPIARLQRAHQELFLDPRIDEVTHRSRTARAQDNAQAQAALEDYRNRLSPIGPLPTLRSVAEITAWYQNTIQGARLEESGIDPFVARWASAHANSMNELVRDGSLLEDWGALPHPREVVITYPTFPDLRSLDNWLHGWQNKAEAGLITDAQMTTITAWADKERARLTTVPVNPPKPDEEEQPAGGIVIPGLGDVTDAIEGFNVGKQLGDLLGIGAAGLTVAGTALFQQIGNASHKGKLGCFQTSMLATLANITRAGAAVAVPTALLGTNPGKAVIDTIGGEFFDLVLNPDLLRGPTRLQDAEANAARLLTEKMGLGMSAHLWAATMEAAAPLKNLGLHQMGAALADLAGFHRLGAMTLGHIEQAAVGEPMRRVANTRHRSRIPSLFDIETAYMKKELPPGPIPDGTPPRAGYTETNEAEPDWNLHALLSQEGQPDWAIRMFSNHLYKDMSTFEIARIGQFFNPQLQPETRDVPDFVRRWTDARPWLLEQVGIDRATWDRDWFFWFKAAASGYAPWDMRVLVETAQRAVVRREQTLFLDAITRLYRDGFIGDQQMETLSREAWGQIPGPDGDYTFRGDPVRARVRATQLRTEAEVSADVRDLVLRAATVGVISDEEAAEQLASLGMPEVRTRLEVLRRKLGLLPNVRLNISLDGQVSGSPEDAQVEVAT